MAGYTRFSQYDNWIEPVAITALDTGTRMAIGRTRNRIEIRIDISHHVGGLQVTPAIGEQWYVEKVKGIYRLRDKIPFNADELHNEAVPGQVQVGSSGPLELNGGQINANAPLRVSAYRTASRPLATSVDMGTMIFDSTLQKPLWSDGTTWRDSAGTQV